MFTVSDRDRTSKYVVDLAASDTRIIGAAVLGSLALKEGDRWSDIDLTFSVRDDSPVRHVIDDWTDRLANDFEAVNLFDVTSGATLYRVFLFPGCLQVDLSFTPASKFGPK